MKYCLFVLLLCMSANSFAQDSTLFNRVINQLGLDHTKIDQDFMLSKAWPNNANETIMVIPEIAKVDKDDEDEFILSSYVLVVKTATGEIISKFFEPSCWYSDAVILSEVIIDTAPYMISKDTRAFGIRVRHHTLSQPNPHGSESISLFVKSDQKKLNRILKDYKVIEYSAEWDTRCAGESVGFEKTFIMTPDKTNNHFDILVKYELKETNSYEDTNGECLSNEKIVTQESVLKFNGEEYTENGAFRSLEVFLNDPDHKPTNIRDAPNGKIIAKLDDTKDYYTLTITEAKKGWFKVVKVEGIEYDDIALPGGTGWIHQSIIGVSTRRKTILLDAPEDGIEVGSIDQETGVQIIDKYKDWVLVEYKGLSGWVESKWLCGNPVTTCP